MLAAQQIIPLVTLALLPLAQGYVPTTPSPNAPTGSNVDPVTLFLRRSGNATFTVSGGVVRVQAGVTAAHPFSGAFVQYDQAFFRQPVFTNSVTTPWVAFVPCDQNVTDVTTDVLNDIDNLRGASSVLFYSVTSESCTLNPTDSGKEIDIYVTTKAETAKLILSQFSNLPDAKFAKFDADLLNQNAASVGASLGNVGSANTSPFLVATFSPANAGGNTGGPTAGSTTSGSIPTGTGTTDTNAGGYTYAPGTGTGTTKAASTPTNAAVGVAGPGSVGTVVLSCIVSFIFSAFA